MPGISAEVGIKSAKNNAVVNVEFEMLYEQVNPSFWCESKQGREIELARERKLTAWSIIVVPTTQNYERDAEENIDKDQKTTKKSLGHSLRHSWSIDTARWFVRIAVRA